MIAILLIMSTNILAFDLDLKDLNSLKSHSISEFTIIEFPKASKEIVELQYSGAPLLAKSDNGIAIFHPPKKSATSCYANRD